MKPVAFLGHRMNDAVSLVAYAAGELVRFPSGSYYPVGGDA